MRTPLLAFIPLAGLLCAATSVMATEDAISPSLTTIDSPFVRSVQPSPWTAFSAAAIEVDRNRLDSIALQSRNSGDVLVRGVPLGADLTVDLRLHEVSVVHPGSRFVLVEADPESSSGTREVELDAPDLVVLAGYVDGNVDDRAAFDKSKVSS